MVLYASEFDQSKYLKAADIGEVGSEKRAKMRVVTKETDVGERQETKACVWFTNLDKGLLLNKTNLRVLQGVFGNSMEAWAGKIVVVFSSMEPFRGKMVPAIRVRIPPPKDDYKAASPKPKPAPMQATDEDVDRINEAEQFNAEITDVDE